MEKEQLLSRVYFSHKRPRGDSEALTRNGGGTNDKFDQV